MNISNTPRSRRRGLVISTLPLLLLLLLLSSFFLFFFSPEFSLAQQQQQVTIPPGISENFTVPEVTTNSYMDGARVERLVISTIAPGVTLEIRNSIFLAVILADLDGLKCVISGKLILHQLNFSYFRMTPTAHIEPTGSVVIQDNVFVDFNAHASNEFGKTYSRQRAEAIFFLEQLNLYTIFTQIRFDLSKSLSVEEGEQIEAGSSSPVVTVSQASVEILRNTLVMVGADFSAKTSANFRINPIYLVFGADSKRFPATVLNRVVIEHNVLPNISRSRSAIHLNLATLNARKDRGPVSLSLLSIRFNNISQVLDSISAILVSLGNASLIETVRVEDNFVTENFNSIKADFSAVDLFGRAYGGITKANASVSNFGLFSFARNDILATGRFCFRISADLVTLTFREFIVERNSIKFYNFSRRSQLSSEDNFVGILIDGDRLTNWIITGIFVIRFNVIEFGSACGNGITFSLQDSSKGDPSNLDLPNCLRDVTRVEFSDNNFTSFNANASLCSSVLGIYMRIDTIDTLHDRIVFARNHIRTRAPAGRGIMYRHYTPLVGRRHFPLVELVDNDVEMYASLPPDIGEARGRSVAQCIAVDMNRATSRDILLHRNRAVLYPEPKIWSSAAASVSASWLNADYPFSATIKDNYIVMVGGQASNAIGALSSLVIFFIDANEKLPLYISAIRVENNYVRFSEPVSCPTAACNVVGFMIAESKGADLISIAHNEIVFEFFDKRNAVESKYAWSLCGGIDFNIVNAGNFSTIRIDVQSTFPPEATITFTAKAEVLNWSRVEIVGNKIVGNALSVFQAISLSNGGYFNLDNFIIESNEVNVTRRSPLHTQLLSRGALLCLRSPFDGSFDMLVPEGLPVPSFMKTIRVRMVLPFGRQTNINHCLVQNNTVFAFGEWISMISFSEANVSSPIPSFLSSSSSSSSSWCNSSTNFGHVFQNNHILACDPSNGDSSYFSTSLGTNSHWMSLCNLFAVFGDAPDSTSLCFVSQEFNLGPRTTASSSSSSSSSFRGPVSFMVTASHALKKGSYPYRLLYIGVNNVTANISCYSDPAMDRSNLDSPSSSSASPPSSALTPAARCSFFSIYETPFDSLHFHMINSRITIDPGYPSLASLRPQEVSVITGVSFYTTEQGNSALCTLNSSFFINSTNITWSRVLLDSHKVVRSISLATLPFGTSLVVGSGVFLLVQPDRMRLLEQIVSSAAIAQEKEREEQQQQKQSGGNSTSPVSVRPLKDFIHRSPIVARFDTQFLQPVSFSSSSSSSSSSFLQRVFIVEGFSLILVEPTTTSSENAGDETLLSSGRPGLLSTVTKLVNIPSPSSSSSSSSSSYSSSVVSSDFYLIADQYVNASTTCVSNIREVTNFYDDATTSILPRLEHERCPRTETLSLTETRSQLPFCSAFNIVPDSHTSSRLLTSNVAGESVSPRFYLILDSNRDTPAPVGNGRFVSSYYSSSSSSSFGTSSSSAPQWTQFLQNRRGLRVKSISSVDPDLLRIDERKEMTSEERREAKNKLNDFLNSATNNNNVEDEDNNNEQDDLVVDVVIATPNLARFEGEEASLDNDTSSPVYESEASYVSSRIFGTKLRIRPDVDEEVTSIVSIFLSSRLLACRAPTPNTSWYETQFPLHNRFGFLSADAQKSAELGASVSAIMALPLDGGLIATTVSRTQALMDIFACTPSKADRPLPFIQSPLGMQIGKAKGRYLVGAVVGNLLIIFCVSALLAATAGIRVWIGERAFEKFQHERHELKKQQQEEEEYEANERKRKGALSNAASFSSQLNNSFSNNNASATSAAASGGFSFQQQLLNNNNNNSNNNEKKKKKKKKKKLTPPKVMTFRESLGATMFPSLLIIGLFFLVQGTIASATGLYVMGHEIFATLAFFVFFLFFVVIGYVVWKLLPVAEKDQLFQYREKTVKEREQLPLLAPERLELILMRLFSQRIDSGEQKSPSSSSSRGVQLLCPQCKAEVEAYEQHVLVLQNKSHQHLSVKNKQHQQQPQRRQVAVRKSAGEKLIKVLMRNFFFVSGEYLPMSISSSSAASQQQQKNNNNNGNGDDENENNNTNNTRSSNNMMTKRDHQQQQQYQQKKQQRQEEQDNDNKQHNNSNNKLDAVFLSRYGRFFAKCKRNSFFFPVFNLFVGFIIALFSGLQKYKLECSQPLMFVTAVVVCTQFVVVASYLPALRNTANSYQLVVGVMSFVLCFCGLLADFLQDQKERLIGAVILILALVKFVSVIFMVIDLAFLAVLRVGPMNVVLAAIWKHLRYHRGNNNNDHDSRSVRHQEFLLGGNSYIDHHQHNNNDDDEEYGEPLIPIPVGALRPQQQQQQQQQNQQKQQQTQQQQQLPVPRIRSTRLPSRAFDNAEL